jgi:hypothetical protein
MFSHTTKEFAMVLLEPEIVVKTKTGGSKPPGNAGGNKPPDFE